MLSTTRAQAVVQESEPERPVHSSRARRRAKRGSPVEDAGNRVPACSCRFPSVNAGGVGGGDDGSSAQGGARVCGASRGLRGEVVENRFRTSARRWSCWRAWLPKVLARALGKRAGRRVVLCVVNEDAHYELFESTVRVVCAFLMPARWRCDVDGMTASWYVRVPTQAES